MVCFVPIVCLSIRKSCQRRDCSELGNVRNWVEHCIFQRTCSANFNTIQIRIDLLSNGRNLDQHAHSGQNTSSKPYGTYRRKLDCTVSETGLS